MPEYINEIGVRLCDATFLALPPFSKGCFCLGWGMGGIWMILEKTMFAKCEGGTAESRRVKCRFSPRELKEKGSFKAGKLFFTCSKMSAG